uniref:uncharacterized protein LOC105353484 n=1 Tax=Fragaria vesca subsp. vesca TaxID=101020 RepID=UPI0005CA53C7|nr:PREDICTED: uncharacterized protein LOC105353484 [Fragaria vesca subsp. vesca]
MDERVPLVAPLAPKNMRPGRVGMPWRRIRGISAYQRYDIQQVARWIEQVLPFSLLLLVVFIRQHLQGFLMFDRRLDTFLVLVLNQTSSLRNKCIKQDKLSKFDEYCLAIA